MSKSNVAKSEKIVAVETADSILESVGLTPSQMESQKAALKAAREAFENRLALRVKKNVERQTTKVGNEQALMGIRSELAILTEKVKEARAARKAKIVELKAAKAALKN